MIKKCSKCKEEKDTTEFYINVRYKDGLSYECKKCIKEYYQIYREKLQIPKRISCQKISENNTKLCIKCKIEKPINEFYKDPVNSTGYNSYCKDCAKETTKFWKLNNKLECIYYYTNGKMECEHCGEYILEFLTLNHIDGTGAEHRKTENLNGQIYLWLIRNNFPEGYNIYCFNCNCGLGAHGYLPEEARDRFRK